MIGRAVSAAAAAVPVAAAAMTTEGAGVQQPTIWFFLGYPFEAASMVAAVFGCVAARFWVGAAAATRAEHRWSLDVPVSAMAIGCAVGLVIAQRPAPLTGLLIGAGIGVIGEGVFKFAERMARSSGAFGSEDEARMKRSVKQLDKID